MSSEQAIREHVMKLSKSKVLKGFYATAIQKQTKASLPLVEEVLSKMVEEGILLKEYEMICSNENCLRCIDHQDSIAKLKSSYDCKYCGEEIEEVETSYINLRFLINRNPK